MPYEAFSETNGQPATELKPGAADHPEDVEPDQPKAAKSQDWLAGRRGLLVGLGLGMTIAAVGMTLLHRPANPPATPAKVTSATAQSVTVAPVTMGQVARMVEATGTVAAFDLLPILPQATGLQIRDVRVDEGQVVQQGDVLAVLDNSVLQSQLDQAQADVASAQAVVRQRQAALAQERARLAEAQSNLRRYTELARQGAISASDLETRQTNAATAGEAVGVAQANVGSAEADVRSKQALVEKIQTQIEQTIVRAPASGLIAERFARIGDATSSTGKLFTIIRNGFLELQVKVPETELPQIRVGAPVQVRSDADRRIQLQATVREISPLVDQQTRQATVKLDLPASALLRSGMFLRASITASTVQAMTIPAKAVLPQTGGKSLVYVLQPDNTVQARTIETGAQPGSNNPDTARVEVKTGLNPSEQVVVSGAGYLKDGDRVTVVRP